MQHKERQEQGDQAERWVIRERRLSADYSPWLRLWEEDVELPGGRVIERFTRVELPDFVVVAAITERREVVIERSYKHAVGRTSISLPAGFVEHEEDPREAARRELLEETGYAAEQWEHLGSFVVDGNRFCGTGHFYLAREARQTASAAPGDLEEITVELLGLEEVLLALRSGEVAQLGAAAAIGLAIAVLR